MAILALWLFCLVSTLHCQPHKDFGLTMSEPCVAVIVGKAAQARVALPAVVLKRPHWNPSTESI